MQVAGGQGRRQVETKLPGPSPAEAGAKVSREPNAQVSVVAEVEVEAADGVPTR